MLNEFCLKYIGVRLIDFSILFWLWFVIVKMFKLTSKSK